MGKYIAVLAAAAVAAVTASTASAALRLQQSVTIRYGSSVVLHGTAPGGSPVSLVGSSGGKTSQAVLSTEASRTGAFRFEVAPTQRTTFVAQSDFGVDRVVVNVMPRIGLRRNGTVRVAPVALFAGKPVVLQQLVGGHWVTLMRAELGRGGVAHVAHWTPGQTLRAYVPAVGHGFVAGTSRILTADGGITLRS